MDGFGETPQALPIESGGDHVAEPIVEPGKGRDLAGLGVKTVIDLQKWGDDDEQGIVEALGMRFVRIPMTTHVPPTPEQIEERIANNDWFLREIVSKGRKLYESNHA